MIKGKALIYLSKGDVVSQVFVNGYDDGKVGILMKNTDLPREPGLYVGLPDIEPEEADVHLVFKDLPYAIETLHQWESLLVEAQKYFKNKGEENNGTL